MHTVLKFLKDTADAVRQYYFVIAVILCATIFVSINAVTIFLKLH
jgi:hypothetical protein